MLLNIKPINSARLNIENPDGIKTKMNLVGYKVLPKLSYNYKFSGQWYP